MVNQYQGYTIMIDGVVLKPDVKRGSTRKKDRTGYL